MSELVRFLEEMDRAVEFARMNDSTGVDRYAALADVAEAIRNALNAPARKLEAAEARVAELEAVYADKITDWEMVLETNYKMSDELARFRLLPCQCPKCGHEHMANVNPHVPKQPLPEPPKEST